jgi:hypothetical protein
MAKRLRHLAVISVCAVIGLAGCGSKAKQAATSTTTIFVTTSTATAPTTTTIAAPTTVATTAPTTTVTVASRAGFTAAKAAWKKGAQDIAAGQGGDWLRAATDLQSGLVHDTGNTSAYAGAIADLKYIASVPETDVPASEAAQEGADVAALNTFFDTPGLYD